MATKIQTYAQLAEDTAKGLTRSLETWTGFLILWVGYINIHTMNSS